MFTDERINGAFETLENDKKEFWNNHESRMKDLSDALSKIDTDDDAEVSKNLDIIGRDLDDLLNDSLVGDNEENTKNKEENNMDKSIATFHHPEVVDMLSMWSKTRLEHFIKVMPNGQFLNGHTQKIETCDGIVMLASGEICPIFYNSICCLNPLSTERHDDCAYLSTCSVAGNIIPDATSITRTVERYNRDQSQFVKNTGIGGFGRYAIVAYHSFKNGW